MNKPTFAALILNYNDSDKIAKALKNVIEQTIPFDEILIIDDGSTDNSVEIISELIKDIPNARIHINQQNIGIIPSCNLGFSLIKSDYIHGISANDLYENCIVEYGHKMLSLFPDAAMISANAASWNEAQNKDGEDLIMRLPQKAAFISSKDYIVQNKIAPVSMNGGANTIKRSAYIEIGGQDIELKWYADWFLYFIIGFKFGFVYVPKIYTTTIIRKSSFSNKMYQWEYQKPTLLRVISLLKERYPEEAKIFKETAIFPSYNLKILIAVMAKEYRWFITPLFIWRCLGHQAGFWLKKYLPRTILTTIRSLFRL